MKNLFITLLFSTNNNDRKSISTKISLCLSHTHKSHICTYTFFLPIFNSTKHNSTPHLNNHAPFTLPLTLLLLRFLFPAPFLPHDIFPSHVTFTTISPYCLQSSFHRNSIGRFPRGLLSITPCDFLNTMLW